MRLPKIKCNFSIDHKDQSIKPIPGARRIKLGPLEIIWKVTYGE